jgi:Flp pilus assembly protein TadG
MSEGHLPLKPGSGAETCFRRGKSRGGSLRCDRAGVAALEFAIVTPVLLLMIFAMLAMGIYLMFVHEVQELASSAARSSVAGLNETERNSLAQQFVTNSVANSALLNAADISLQTTTSGTPPTNYAVTISYTLKDTPIPMLASLISVPLNNISRTSTIEFGGY